MTNKEVAAAIAKIASHNELMRALGKPEITESLELIDGLVKEYRSIQHKKNMRENIPARED